MLMYLTIIDSKEGQQKFEFIYISYSKTDHGSCVGFNHA